LSFLISYTIPHFHSSVHLTKSPKCLKQNKDTSWLIFNFFTNTNFFILKPKIATQ
jgi:hypothetical protein